MRWCRRCSANYEVSGCDVLPSAAPNESNAVGFSACEDYFAESAETCKEVAKYQRSQRRRHYLSLLKNGERRLGGGMKALTIVDKKGTNEKVRTISVSTHREEEKKNVFFLQEPTDRLLL
jgi:hypothetical protein